MTDRHIDIELILALAEGSLPDDEAAAAEQSLDDAARAELAYQRQALGALSEISTVALSDAERNDLHGELREKLHLQGGNNEQPVATRRVRQPWYVRALPVFGALAALVLVVGIGLNSIGLGGGDETETASVQTGDDAVGAPNGGAQFSRESDGVSELQGSTEARTMTTEAMAPEPLTSTMAASDAAAESDSGFVGLMMFPDDLGEVSLGDLDQLAALVEEGATRVREFAPYAYNDLPEAASQPGLVCWQALLDQETPTSQIDYLGTATIDEEPGEVYRTLGEDDTVTIYVFTRESCAVAAILRP